ncbi:MAG: CopG family antitoxin [bacterium]
MNNDSTGYIEWDKAKSVIMPKLKPSTETISLRLPEHLLFELKYKSATNPQEENNSLEHAINAYKNLRCIFQKISCSPHRKNKI